MQRALQDFFIDLKGQTAIEVILMLAVVIVIVTTIGLYLKGKASDITQERANDLNKVLEQASNK